MSEQIYDASGNLVTTGLGAQPDKQVADVTGAIISPATTESYGPTAGGTAATKSVLGGAIFTSSDTPPSLTAGQMIGLQCDNEGSIWTNRRAKHTLGTLTAINQTLESGKEYADAYTVVITGTWTGTIVPEISADDGATWVQVPFSTIPNAGALGGVPQIISSVTANGVYRVALGGAIDYARVRASTAMTGTANISILATPTPSNFRYTLSQVLQSVYNSAGNGTSANLASAAVFTGTADTTLGVDAIKVYAFADKNLKIDVQFSLDGTNWDMHNIYYVSASVGDARTFTADGPFVRTVVTNNDATSTTAIRVGTGLVPISATLPGQLTADGNLRVALEGNSDKPTYSAAASGFTVGTAPTDIFTIFGSATKVIRITKITVSQTQTSAGPETFSLYKRTAADTGGTRTACVVVPHDSTNVAATATVGFYTGATAPTINGSATQLLFSYRGAVPSAAGTSTSAGVPVVLFDAVRPSQAIVLRGVAEGVAINGTAAGNICSCTVEFTEE